ncbi:hypothetical protein [Halogranum amylolyticum]|uniref:hypothetical protein n=1 Tax=Halogranum amylolyticum TaxID=660520 RepID=UPI001B8B9A06|nr:hypothetical protein [Halogranum amylolyticum]
MRTLGLQFALRTTPYFEPSLQISYAENPDLLYFIPASSAQGTHPEFTTAF